MTCLDIAGKIDCSVQSEIEARLLCSDGKIIFTRIVLIMMVLVMMMVMDPLLWRKYKMTRTVLAISHLAALIRLLRRAVSRSPFTVKQPNTRPWSFQVSSSIINTANDCDGDYSQKDEEEENKDKDKD